MIRATSIAGLLLLGAMAVPADAQGKGKGGKPEVRATSTAAPTVTVVFRDSDQATFRDYFRTNKIVGKPLPPGIAKNVARGKPLPPGIAKRSLPPALLAKAPRADDITFSILGDVVVAMRRDVVVDILRNVF